MIFKVWAQIILIFMIASAPLLLLNYLQQEETLLLTLESGPEKALSEKIPTVIRQLKVLADLIPERAQEFYGDYQEWLVLQKSIIEWENLKPIILKRLQRSTLIQALLLLLIAMISAFFVARGLTKKFRFLLNEQMQSQRREADLRSLVQWQETVRSLVHELRGPLTPIKLVTTAILDERQQENSETPQWKEHRDGLELALQKIQQMENMIQKFMAFAKLPEAQLELRSLNDVIRAFTSHYHYSFSDKLEFRFNSVVKSEPKLLIDEGLLHNALFAMAQNAKEALAEGQRGTLTFTIQKSNKLVRLLVNSTGSLIPESVVPRLFQIGTSSKMNRQNNFGIGLAMAKKIMLEHHGDLKLVCNSPVGGVTFEFNFPIDVLENTELKYPSLIAGRSEPLEVHSP